MVLIVLWGVCLILGFPLLQWSAGMHMENQPASFAAALDAGASACSMVSARITEKQSLPLADYHGIRLPPQCFDRLRESRRNARSCLRGDDLAPAKLAHLRAMYEPFAYSLCVYLLITLPEWLLRPVQEDNWRKHSSEHGQAKFAVSDPFQERVQASFPAQ